MYFHPKKKKEKVGRCTLPRGLKLMAEYKECAIECVMKQDFSKTKLYWTYVLGLICAALGLLESHGSSPQAYLTYVWCTTTTMSNWMEHLAMYLNLEGRYRGVLGWHSVELWDKFFSISLLFCPTACFPLEFLLWLHVSSLRAFNISTGLLWFSASNRFVLCHICYRIGF